MELRNLSQNLNPSFLFCPVTTVGFPEFRQVSKHFSARSQSHSEKKNAPLIRLHCTSLGRVETGVGVGPNGTVSLPGCDVASLVEFCVNRAGSESPSLHSLGVAVYSATWTILSLL